MRIIKLDGRYQYYPEFTHAIYFPMREYKTEQAVFSWCMAQYGVPESWESSESGLRKFNNPNWRYNKKKRRIYLKNQADISMALLMA